MSESVRFGLRFVPGADCSTLEVLAYSSPYPPTDERAVCPPVSRDALGAQVAANAMYSLFEEAVPELIKAAVARLAKQEEHWGRSHS